MPTKKILIVDDEPQIVELLENYLSKEGYAVATAGDGEAALTAAERENPDLILLDLMLPKINGYEVCKELRLKTKTPIIMLTARDEEPDKIVGLELGADDYITKPFSPREVVARVRAVLRRAEPESGEARVIRAGGLEIDSIRHEVRKSGKAIELTPTEFKLLETLADSPRRVFTRLQLVEEIQGYSFEGYERTIDAHIKNLRQKIEDDPKNPRLVGTVYGVGYRFELEGE
jgi:two-component system, OmpR family, alkaline phosphatase synthesis response regulator PhoP